MSDKNGWPASVDRVARALEDKGIAASIVTTRQSARTAEEAAQAVGTTVARIVKSLVFRGAQSGTAWCLLVSGANRVDAASAQGLAGEALERADAEFVRAMTGFAIGGVAPVGTAQPMNMLMDEDLFDHSAVWAAAGSPTHVFEAAPLQLRSATGARVGRLKAAS